MTIGREELTAWLDELLELERWSAADASLNGLQVEGADRIDKVALAVDSGTQVFELARRTGAGMLIVHHGLFWGKPLAITGSHRERVRLLLDADISLYAAHLPLDFHPRLGHNACIARILELEDHGPLTTESGLGIGTLGSCQTPLPREEFVERLDNRLETGGSTVLPFGPREVRNVGLVSGSGGKLLDEPLSARIDTFVTGETSHTVYHFAREYGVNVVFAGHYATEVPGLRALAAELEERFGVPHEFIPLPTGL